MRCGQYTKEQCKEADDLVKKWMNDYAAEAKENKEPRPKIFKEIKKRKRGIK